MKRKYSKYVILLIIIAGISIGIVCVRAYEHNIFNSSQISSKAYDDENIEIVRTQYKLRHFMWSGIFPLYGGFIEDPHYLSTKIVDVTKELQPIIHAQKTRYQLLQVNPFFEDHTTENILAMEIDGVTYEYQLEVPQDFRYYSSKSEPSSVFLYSEHTLYFIMQYNYGEEFLVYEISPPFVESKYLTYNIIDMNANDNENILNIALNMDQVDALRYHTYSYFYSLYTGYMNKQYAANLLNSKKQGQLTLPIYYGSRLNINRFQLKNQIENPEYKEEVGHLHEFITSIKNVNIGYIEDQQQIYLNLMHDNYYEVVTLGDSFDDSTFSIQNEEKTIFMDVNFVDTLLRYINQYNSLRSSETDSVVYFKEEDRQSKSLFELTTAYSDQLSIERTYPYIAYYPVKQLQQRQSLNSTQYSLPNLNIEEKYLFIIEFYDHFSLKLTSSDVSKLEQFLLDIKENIGTK